MLELEGITRRFGERTVLQDVSFSVAPGRLTGFVGANGAGKTTTMRIVLGVLGAHAGSVRWHGNDVDLVARRRFGYMPEERGLYPKMAIVDQLVFLARLHGVDAGTARQRSTSLLENLGLGERSRDRLETLSLGNQQRVQVAAALVHEPELLVLDEPFSGLDPVAVDAMGAQLRERASAGVPVLFSSHQLELVESLCDDVVILDEGRVVAAGSAAELRGNRSGSQYRLVVGQDAGWVRDLPGVTVLDVDGRAALVELDDPGADQELLHQALRRGAVHEFTPVVPTLSEIYREVTMNKHSRNGGSS